MTKRITSKILNDFYNDKEKKNVCKKLRMFINEETKSSKLYKKLGFNKQAKDEADHAKFFKKKLKMCLKKKVKKK